MKTLTLAAGTALLLTAATALAAWPGPPGPQPYTCRSALAGPYWSGGVESDVCAGIGPDGTLRAEAITGMDPGGRINPASGAVTACTARLDRIDAGRAGPVPGGDVDESGRHPEYFDSSGFCDAIATWTPPPGVYAVTVLYRTPGGHWTQTLTSAPITYPGR